jgi:hypothetical protein
MLLFENIIEPLVLFARQVSAYDARNDKESTPDKKGMRGQIQALHP